MPYYSNGQLKTDIREVAIDTTWDSQTDWEAYQSATRVDITSGVVSLAEVTIPDPNIYLHDDWGDNKLQNRDGSGTTTYNGVTGVYRPEWTLDIGTPVAQNQRLELDGGDGIYTGINLDLSTTVTWEWSVITTSNDNSGLIPFAQTTTRSDLGQSLNNGYWVQLNLAVPRIRLLRNDSGSSTTIISNSTGLSDGDTVSLTRTPAGEWELFKNGASLGTATDSTFTDPQYTAFGKESGSPGTMTVDQIKVD